MAIKYSVLLLMLIIIMLPFLSYASSSTYSSCPVTKPFLHDLQLQCPTTIMYTWPLKMNGESLDNVLNSNQTNTYVAILFYASWCPFSRTLQPKFDALSSMYPQVKHVTVEQSSVPPIVFSRYGIHGVPSILITNRTTRIRFHGPNDLYSLVHFYAKTTGLKPVMDLTEDSVCFPENKSRRTELNSICLYPNEPYLIFSLLFIFSKAVIYLYPNMVSNAAALWLAYIPHLNLAIFGESRQLLARVLQLADFKRAFGKLKVIRSARAWTSSL